MDKQKRIRRDRLQSLLIFALSISAIYLFSLTASIEVALPQLSLQSSPVEDVEEGTSMLQELDWPSAVVISDGVSRRYQQLSTADSEFTSLEGLLEDLFREGFSPHFISLAEFQQALALPGIYIGFPSPVPLCILSERLGLPSLDESKIQRILLVSSGETVLFYHSDGERYYLSRTALTVSGLHAASEGIGGSNCLFAFEQENSSLHPLTVLPMELPQYTQLSASAVSDPSITDALLSFFDFNAHTTNRYVESSGTEVIVESPRKLSISPTGRISYLGSTTHAPEGFALSEQSSLSELVDGAYHLLTQLSAGSDALQFYLSDAEYNHSTGEWRLRFSRMVGGLPLLSGDGEAAAELLIEDGTVVGFSYLLRSYADSDIPTLLLPVPQASAIAARHEGKELVLSYVDNGGDNAAVSWLMR